MRVATTPGLGSTSTACRVEQALVRCGSQARAAVVATDASPQAAALASATSCRSRPMLSATCRSVHPCRCRDESVSSGVRRPPAADLRLTRDRVGQRPCQGQMPPPSDVLLVRLIVYPIAGLLLSPPLTTRTAARSPPASAAAGNPTTTNRPPSPMACAIGHLSPRWTSDAIGMRRCVGVGR
jgi:hypothetical protein